MASFKDTWDNLEPHKKQSYKKAALIAVAVVVGLMLFYGTGRDAPPPPPKEEVTPVQIGEDLLQDELMKQIKDGDSATAEAVQKEREAREAALAEMAEKEQRLKALENTIAAFESYQDRGDTPESWGAGINPPNSATPAGEQANAQTYSSNIAPPAPVELVGGISRVGGSLEADVAKAANEKKRSKRFYLPVSFMPARVLTGLRAKTVKGANANPEPMLLRVQAPAILPNDLRSDLEGCFVVAHGYGDLSSERIETRTVSLNCVDTAGASVIEEEITGIVVDKDGVKGLAAHPVSKMGTNLARLAFGAALEGMGSAFSEQATTTTLTPLGGQQTAIDSDQIGRAGAGAAAQSASKAYSEIIADLVRQQAPVLEMGPGKEVVVALTEGVWLNIKDYEGGSQ